MTAYFQTAGGAPRRPRPWHIAVIVTAMCWPLAEVLPTWLPYLAAVVTAVLCWRRRGEWKAERGAMSFAFGWDQSTPPGREIETSDRVLDQVAQCAYRAATAQEVNAESWFGGAGAAARDLIEIRNRAVRESQARASGYAVPGGRTSARDDADLDLPPTDADAAPVSPDAEGWAHRLQSKGDEW